MIKIIIERTKSLPVYPSRESFINSCVFKNLMLGNDYKSLKENLGESNDALDLLLLLTENELENDELFFYVDTNDTIKKIETLFSDYRDTSRKDQIDRMNALIIKFNQIQYQSAEEKQLNYIRYASMQKKLRRMRIRTDDELKNLLQNDIIYISSLKVGQNDDYVNGSVFSETEYFIDRCPQIFQDKVVYDNTLLKLNENAATTGVFKKRYHQSLIKTMTVKTMTDLKK